ncbi:hypothetical protein ACVWW5_003479 [Bradyrhizobium sp. LM3.4]
MTMNVGREHRFERLRFEMAAKLLRNEGHRQSQVGCKRRHPRLPLAAAQWIIHRIGFQGLHEACAALTNAQAQAVATQRPLRRVIIDRLEMFARALVTRVRRDDRRSVEMRHAIGIDEKLELDFTGGPRGGVRLGWPGCGRRLLRWRLVDHSALDDPLFRAGLVRFTLAEEAGDDLHSLVVFRDRIPVRRARSLASRLSV